MTTNKIQAMKPMFHEQRGAAWRAPKGQGPAAIASSMAALSLMPAPVSGRRGLP